MRVRSLPVCLLLAACGAEEPSADPGPEPGPAQSEQARAAMQRYLQDDGSGMYRLAPPARDRLPRYLFEPQVDGQPAAFGWIHGWRIDVFATAARTYQRGETPYMVFFRDGRLLGIFVPNDRAQAPFGLDRWAALRLEPAPGR